MKENLAALTIPDPIPVENLQEVLPESRVGEENLVAAVLNEIIEDAIKEDETEEIEAHSRTSAVHSNVAYFQDAQDNNQQPIQGEKRKKRTRRGGKNRLCVVCSRDKKVQLLRPCRHRLCTTCAPLLKDKICPRCGTEFESYLPQAVMDAAVNKDEIVPEPIEMEENLTTATIPEPIPVENLQEVLPESRVGEENLVATVVNEIIEDAIEVDETEQIEAHSRTSAVHSNVAYLQDAQDNNQQPIQGQKRKRRTRRGGKNRLCVVCSLDKKVQLLRPCRHRLCTTCAPLLKDKICPRCGTEFESYLPQAVMDAAVNKDVRPQ